MSPKDHLTDVRRSARLARDYTQARDWAIRVAHETGGFSLREIAEAAGLSHTQIANIVRK